jgi:hypothetical protein
MYKELGSHRYEQTFSNGQIIVVSDTAGLLTGISDPKLIAKAIEFAALKLAGTDQVDGSLEQSSIDEARRVTQIVVLS